jgi:cobalt-zinc-cadmium efflux system membrane fusion protein
VELPGRIGYDEEKLAHITPRYAGLARSVPARLGTYVAKGEVLATIESNASMTTYPVVAPFNGHIVEKHLALGEHVTEESEVFLLANLSTVWVNCDVYAANVDDIRVGAQATIQATGSGRTAAGTIRYISPAFDSRSSSGLARIVLANPGLKWRPGMFVRATVAVEQADSALVVHCDAVQVLDGETVVFLPGPHNSFTNTRVVPGRRTREYVEVLEGLREGDAYISGGAFELKATIVTSGMDPHAGHGH